MFQFFKLNLLNITKAIGQRCLISNASSWLFFFSKSTGESPSRILSSVSHKSCCLSSCCWLQPAIFTFFLGDRFEGFFWCFSNEIKLFRQKMLLKHSSRFADSKTTFILSLLDQITPSIPFWLFLRKTKKS